MRVTYCGPATEGVVVDAIGPAVIRPGESVEVDDDLGASLLEQTANWQPTAVDKPKKES